MDEKPEQPHENISPSSVAPVSEAGIEEQEPASSGSSRVAPIVSEKKKSKRLLYVVLGIIFTVAVCCGVYFSLYLLQKSVVSSAANTANTTSNVQKTSATATPITPYTEIDSGLQDINNTLTQAAGDQTQADKAMSDSEQQITVPTE